jgi:hypothetical protein
MPMRRIRWKIAKEEHRSRAREYFEDFKNRHLARGTWSPDWDESWRRYCRKSLELDRQFGEKPRRQRDDTTMDRPQIEDCSWRSF